MFTCKRFSEILFDKRKIVMHAKELFSFVWGVIIEEGKKILYFHSVSLVYKMNKDYKTNFYQNENEKL